jgi:hypothetical protein
MCKQLAPYFFGNLPVLASDEDKLDQSSRANSRSAFSAMKTTGLLFKNCPPLPEFFLRSPHLPAELTDDCPAAQPKAARV